MKSLTFTIESQGRKSERNIRIDRLIVAGWTGRNREKMEEHIIELEKLGVKRPVSTPVFYRVSAARLTFNPLIEVPGASSSGEAEPLLIHDGERILLGLASDHTDRAVEAYGITVSKQMCDKPCAPICWLLDEVFDHWDALELTSMIEENGVTAEYQRGRLAAMFSPKDLISALERAGGTFKAGTAMLCGTLPAIGGVRPSSFFEMTLSDPALGRSISHRYEVLTLPVEG